MGGRIIFFSLDLHQTHIGAPGQGWVGPDTRTHSPSAAPVYCVLCKHSLFKGATETAVVGQHGNKINTLAL
jgi:hypothetical protein